MSSTPFVMEIESEDITSLQISNLEYQERVDQDRTIQDVESVENVFRYLNLSDQPQGKDYSRDMFEYICKVKTKKDNYIIIKIDDLQEFECGYCQRKFPYSQSLGGHVQKDHRKEKNKNAGLPTIQLRTRPNRYGKQ